MPILPRHAATIAGDSTTFPTNPQHGHPFGPDSSPSKAARNLTPPAWLSNIWRKVVLRPLFNRSSAPRSALGGTGTGASFAPRPSLPDVFLRDPVPVGNRREGTATPSPLPTFHFGRYSLDESQLESSSGGEDVRRQVPVLDSGAETDAEQPTPVRSRGFSDVLKLIKPRKSSSRQMAGSPTPSRFTRSLTVKGLTLSPLSTGNIGLPNVCDSPTDTEQDNAKFTFPEGVKDLTGQLMSVVLIAPGNNDVYRAQLVDSQQAVAVKVFRPRPSIRETDEEAAAMQSRTHLRVQREASVWHSLGGHDNVVELLGYAVVDGSPCLISPWSRNGNAYQYLKRNPDADRRALILDVADGLMFLHSQDPPIVHADIKGYNVLVSDSGRGMLCDFGNSVTLADDPSGLTTPNVGQGTTRWSAPEVLLGEPVTTKADVYSFGILALELMSDKLPYYKLQVQAAVILAKASGRMPSRESYPELPAIDPFWPLLFQCWDSDADARPTMEKICSTLRLWQLLFEYKRPERPRRNQTIA